MLYVEENEINYRYCYLELDGIRFGNLVTVLNYVFSVFYFEDLVDVEYCNRENRHRNQ